MDEAAAAAEGASEQRRVLPCIVCDGKLFPVFDSNPAQPNDAVMFSAYGQYGSTVFDPQDHSQLFVNICDKCLTEKGRAGTVWHACYVRRPAIIKFEEQWKPDKDGT